MASVLASLLRDAHLVCLVALLQAHRPRAFTLLAATSPLSPSAVAQLLASLTFVFLGHYHAPPLWSLCVLCPPFTILVFDYAYTSYGAFSACFRQLFDSG